MGFAAHAETIWSARAAKPHPQAAPIHYTRQRWDTPDGDFIDVDYLKRDQAEHRPVDEQAAIWVLFHGLEGSAQSHYAKAFARYAQNNGLDYCVPHFRGCSGEINRMPRAYHSGDWQEIDWILRRVKQQHTGKVYAVGVSLGGNALMRWAGELGSAAIPVIAGAVSICAPLDLTAAGHHLGRGINRYIYTPLFLKTLKPNALRKWNQFPQLFNKEQMLASRDLYEFDNAVTAPLHGFKNTDDYWLRASAKPHLTNIAVPSLLINACNDPFIPAHSLVTACDISAPVRLWQPKRGGHVGFVSEYTRHFPGHLQLLPSKVGQFFKTGAIDG